MISGKSKVLYIALALVAGIAYPILNNLLFSGLATLLFSVRGESLNATALFPYGIELVSNLILGAVYVIVMVFVFRERKPLPKMSHGTLAGGMSDDNCGEKHGSAQVGKLRKVSAYHGMIDKLKHISIPEILKCIVIGGGTFGISTLWISLAGKIPAFSESMEIFEKMKYMYAYGGFLSIIVLPVLLAPVIEEIVFKGIVLRGLEKVKAGAFAVIVSAFLFGIGHMIPVQLVYTFIMGIITGFVYVKRRSLIYPIAIHMTNNLLSSIEVAFPSGAKALDIIAVALIIPMGYLLYCMAKTKSDDKSRAVLCA